MMSIYFCVQRPLLADSGQSERLSVLGCCLLSN